MINFPKTVTCKYCGLEQENDPGSYYHQKSCEARFLRDCIKRETNPEVIRKLKLRLEMALYVGD